MVWSKSDLHLFTPSYVETFEVRRYLRRYRISSFVSFATFVVKVRAVLQRYWGNDLFSPFLH